MYAGREVFKVITRRQLALNFSQSIGRNDHLDIAQISAAVRPSNRREADSSD